MAKIQVPFYALNSGEVSADALARVDLEKMKLACEQMENYFPSVLGPAEFRPGTSYVNETRSSAESTMIPFIYSAEKTDTALLMIDAVKVQVYTYDSVSDEQALLTRVSVSTTVTNGAFGSAIGTGWTDVSDDDGAITATIASSALRLTSTKYGVARVRNAVTVSNTDKVKVHGLRITVTSGPVTCRIGTATSDDSLIATTQLKTGEHSLGFTPGVNTFYIEFEAPPNSTRKVTNCTIESAGTVQLSSPYNLADLLNIKWAQSADVVFLACDGYQPYQIERRNAYSWSLVRYSVDKGPWRTPNITRITMSPSVRSGTGTLTASKKFFKSTHVGAIFRLTHNYQYAQNVLSGESQSTDWIRVTGVNAERKFNITITGTWVGTLYLERAIGAPDGFNRVEDNGGGTTPSGTGNTGTGATSWTANATDTFYDSPGSGNTDGGTNNDNQIIYYRISFRNGSWTSGSATVNLRFNGGAKTGRCRVSAYNSATSVDIDVLDDFSRTSETDTWQEGEWCDYRGWPVAVALFDGRLWWAGADKIWGSVSDDYTNFDPNTEGDSGPINRSLGIGPVQGVRWMLPLARLIVGSAANETVVRSNSLDEPLSPTNFNAKAPSTRGSANVSGVPIDNNGIFVQRSEKKAFELSVESSASDYTSTELTRLNPQVLGTEGIRRLAVQRHPDTRVWFVREDGVAAVLIYEKSDQVVGWSRFVTDGDVEDVAVLPGDGGDRVYLVVKRNINGSTKRYIERLRSSEECVGDTENWNVDCGKTFTHPTGTTLITGLSHLEGEQVVVWANGQAWNDQSNMKTVSGGQISVTAGVLDAVVGLPYDGKFKTTKLAYASEQGTPLSQVKRVDHIAILARYIGFAGLTIGADFDTMYSYTDQYQGEVLTGGGDPGVDTTVGVIETFDELPVPFPGGWQTDSRVCIKQQAPYPGKILGLVVHMTTVDKNMEIPNAAR
jgi:hypothetical protein